MKSPDALGAAAPPRRRLRHRNSNHRHPRITAIPVPPSPLHRPSPWYTTHSTWFNGQMYYNGRLRRCGRGAAAAAGRYSALSYADPAECLREHGDSALCEDDTAATVFDGPAADRRERACSAACAGFALRRGGRCGDRSAENRCCGDRCCGGCCDDDDRHCARAGRAASATRRAPARTGAALGP